MCNPAFAAVPVAAYAANTIINPKGGDGPTDDRKKQMEDYRNMSDEERTEYEIQWAEGHGGWGGESRFGNSQDASDFYQSHGYDRGGEGFDYSNTYSNMPRPRWMQGIYEELRESGEDARPEVHAINPMAYSGFGRRSPPRGGGRGGPQLLPGTRHLPAFRGEIPENYNDPTGQGPRGSLFIPGTRYNPRHR